MIPVIDSVLLNSEKLNVYLAVAIKAIKCVHDETPGEWHVKKKRLCKELYMSLLQEVSCKLIPVRKTNINVCMQATQASEEVLHELTDMGYNRIILLLNLTLFCIEELPVREKHFRMLNAILLLWEDSQVYANVFLGEEIFSKIEGKLEVLLAKQHGIIL